MTEHTPTQFERDHDRRIGRLEGIVEQLDRRLDGIERAIDELGRQLNARMDAQFRWLVGIQITTLIALGTLILSLKP